MDQTNIIAAKLIRRLKTEGFVIQRYDSVTTNSIYLKLDYGVGNSIRIGDHKGKRQYKYRYNVDIGRTQINRHTTPEGWPRWYYPETNLDDLIADIVNEKLVKIRKYGKENYRHYMKQNQVDNRESKGFWQQATLV